MPTAEQNAYIASTFGVDPATYSPAAPPDLQTPPDQQSGTDPSSAAGPPAPPDPQTPPEQQGSDPASGAQTTPPDQSTPQAQLPDAGSATQDDNRQPFLNAWAALKPRIDVIRQAPDSVRETDANAIIALAQQVQTEADQSQYDKALQDVTTLRAMVDEYERPSDPPPSPVQTDGNDPPPAPIQPDVPVQPADPGQTTGSEQQGTQDDRRTAFQDAWEQVKPRLDKVNLSTDASVETMQQDILSLSDQIQVLADGGRFGDAFDQIASLTHALDDFDAASANSGQDDAKSAYETAWATVAPRVDTASQTQNDAVATMLQDIESLANAIQSQAAQGHYADATAQIDTLSRELDDFFNAASTPATPPDTPYVTISPPGADGSDGGLIATLSAIDAAAPSSTASDLFEINDAGKTRQLTENQLSDLRGKLRSQIADAVDGIASRAQLALGSYESQKAAMASSPVSAGFVVFIDALRNQSFKDPYDDIHAQVDAAQAAVAATKAVLSPGALAPAGQQMLNAEVSAAKASKIASAFANRLQDSGTVTISDLETVVSVCKYSLLLLSVFTPAVAAGIIAGTLPPALDVAVQLAEDKPVNWAQFAVDEVFGAVMGSNRFGGAMVDRVKIKLFREIPAGIPEDLWAATVTKVIASLGVNGVAEVLKAQIKMAIGRAQGQTSLTPAQYIGNLLSALVADDGPGWSVLRDMVLTALQKS